MEKKIFTEDEIRTFKSLFGKYCKSEMEAGRCDDCEFCCINDAYTAIFDPYEDCLDEDENDEAKTTVITDSHVRVANVQNLARDLIDDLGNGPTTESGDLSSTYFTLLTVTVDGEVSDVSVALLKADVGYYTVHFVDDVNETDAELHHTEHLDERELARLLLELQDECLRMKDVGIRTHNMGIIPLEDYRDIRAQQLGFNSYADLRTEGLRLDVFKELE